MSETNPNSDLVVVTADVRKRRVDRYLADLGRWGSRSRVQRLIAAGRVEVDGEVVHANQNVAPGQRIRICDELDDSAPSRVEPEAMDLAVLFEDDAILVLDKPAGVVVHPAAGNWTGTLVAGVLQHWGGSRPGLDPLRPGLVHRLDKDTSGVLAVAKDTDALANLSRQFQARTVEKVYLAFVWGRPDRRAGLIEEPIGRSTRDRKKMAPREGGRAASTHFEVLASDDEISLLRLRPKTGRTHQIRVHLNSIGHPIVGDETYGGAAGRPVPPGIRRQALHAAKLSIDHPRNGERMVFTAPLPGDLAALRGRLFDP